MTTIRLAMAQALVRFLAAQTSEIDVREYPLFAGAFAIFGHGNVAGLGEALYGARERLPTLRAHNEQAMALAAVAFAKASRRRCMMACTSSIGPGATNMVTAAAMAHANRLPVLLLPGDIFAGRRPDPVLQQIEAFGDPTISVNDCFRPVSRWWDRITRPEQIIESLPQAMRVLTDPAECGPVTLALPQDVQAEALVQMAASDRLRWHAELAEVVDGQAEGGSGAVRGSPLRPRSHHPVRALVPSLQAQSARLGGDDGRAQPVDGAYDHHALGAALRPGVRETLAPVCPGGRPVMAGRRDLRQDPRRVVLPVPCR